MNEDKLNDAASDPLTDKVEVKIRALLREGLAVTPDVSDYLEATLGAADPATVADLLAHPGESEGETLLELVFFPDADFQCGLEVVLAGRGLSDRDRKRLARRLADTPAGAALVFPGHSQRLRCDLPVAGVEAFITRLNLGWAIVPQLHEALDKWDQQRAGDATADRYTLMVGLRNAALVQSCGQVGLLVDFLERMPPADRRWSVCFDFLMAFLAEHADSTNLYRALMARKAFLLHHRMKAQRNAERMRRSNMETLSMSGFRAGHFDLEAAAQALVAIDAVALAVYGRTEAYDEAPVHMDLGEMDAGGDIEGLVRRLS
ncbi:MAG: hypothetical protein PVG19_11275 [Desulfobacterales bacterium]|jgi:hypothetical protein